MASTTKIIKAGLLSFLCFFLFHCASRTSVHHTSVHVVDRNNRNEIEQLVSLANAFKATLSTEQIKILQLGWSKTDAVKWSNFPQAFSNPQRVGIGFSQLSPNQVSAAKALLAFVLDDKTQNEGLDETEGILAADNLVATLPGRDKFFGAGNYYIAFLGEPSTTGLWQLQFGGHHLAVSNTYKDGKLIGMTPSFRGVEPMTPIEANGKHYQPMEQERAAFEKVLSSLSETELTTARLAASFADIMLGPGKDNQFPSIKQGLKVGLLSKEIQGFVLLAIGLYVKDLKSIEADKILATYNVELPDTFIAFSGNRELNEVGDYFRIDGPGVWIEYHIQPSRDIKNPPIHPHSIWRDHKSDYGGQ